VSALRRAAGAVSVAAALATAVPAAAAPPPKAKAALPAGERVDLNRAPVEELMRLPGVGRKRAEAIVALRDRRPLRRVEDLAQVKGISPAWVAKHRNSLEVGTPVAAVPSARPGGVPPARAAVKP
jgi:competence protein ComEA